MKTFIKYRLSCLGLLPIFDFIRRLPAVVHWINSGCINAAPPPIKRIVLKSYLNRYGLTHFIETGTYHGDTLAYIAQQKKVHSISIELNKSYYQAAKLRFDRYPNVTLLNGDSGTLLPDLLLQLQTPTLFWLDGHYSGGETGRGEENTPILAELDSILNSPVKGHVILIDDARCFDGTQDYPYLDQLLETIRRDKKYLVEVSVDIIRLTPQN